MESNVMRENLEMYLTGSETAADFESRIPFHVEATYRQCLKCGILAHGFARVYCANCRHDFLARTWWAVLRFSAQEQSLENPLWGAPRIHGELLKLGYDI